MKPEKYNRTVTMNCPTCGGTQFRLPSDGSSELVTCASCDRTLTRVDLLQENSENIAAHVEEVKAEVMKDITTQFRDSIKRATRGSKYLRFR